MGKFKYDLLDSSRPIITFDMGYGDAGKGSTVDFLCHEYSREYSYVNFDNNSPVVVRYNGGAQAAHRVVTTEGKEHVFRQVGSGFLQGARTYLSKGMYLNPITLYNEIMDLSDLTGLSYEEIASTIIIDSDIFLTHPIDVELNRIDRKESGEKNTCGMGIYHTFKRSVYLEKGITFDVNSHDNIVYETTEEIRIRNKESFNRSLKAFNTSIAFLKNNCKFQALFPVTTKFIFEGAQGFEIGMYTSPIEYATPSDTSITNALLVLAKLNRPSPFILGILRTYAVRHGDGPFAEMDERDKRSFFRKELDLDPRNVDNYYQGKPRYGFHNLYRIKEIMHTQGVHALCVNCVDQVKQNPLSNFPTAILGYGDKTNQKYWC